MVFKQNPVTLRFIETFNSLRDQKVFLSNSDFAKAIGFSPQSLNEILKNRRDVTIEVLRKLFIVYGVSPAYIFGVHDETQINSVIENAQGDDVDFDVIDIYLGNIKPLLIRITDVEKTINRFLKNSNEHLFQMNSISETKIQFARFEKTFLNSLQENDKTKFTDFREQLFNYYQSFSEYYFKIVELLIEILNNDLNGSSKKPKLSESHTNDRSSTKRSSVKAIKR